MAYEAQGRELAAQLAEIHGRLLEARLESGRAIVLKFERGEWAVPSNFIFKYGYSGSGPDCFHAVLQASGFSIPKSRVENAAAGEILLPGN